MIIKISDNLNEFDHKKISQIILDQANILDGNVLSNPSGYMESLTELFVKPIICLYLHLIYTPLL